MGKRLSRGDLFREVNLKIHSLADNTWGDLEYVCECGDAMCYVLVSATREEFSELVADPGAYLIAPGHARANHEVVRQRDGHLIARLAPAPA